MIVETYQTLKNIILSIVLNTTQTFLAQFQHNKTENHFTAEVFGATRKHLFVLF